MAKLCCSLFAARKPSEKTKAAVNTKRDVDPDEAAGKPHAVGATAASGSARVGRAARHVPLYSNRSGSRAIEDGIDEAERDAEINKDAFNVKPGRRCSAASCILCVPGTRLRYAR